MKFQEFVDFWNWDSEFVNWNPSSDRNPSLKIKLTLRPTGRAEHWWAQDCILVVWVVFGCVPLHFPGFCVPKINFLARVISYHFKHTIPTAGGNLFWQDACEKLSLAPQSTLVRPCLLVFSDHLGGFQKSFYQFLFRNKYGMIWRQPLEHTILLFRPDFLRGISAQFRIIWALLKPVFEGIVAAWAPNW